ncbi:MAG TPA: heterodisulfide reductase-related iron-sulfur binding cluster, partial [Opitutaceae bacterium]|nr:heterodisulfide reductase-related iron-sulfur binding cluster [Opitutaceae bacterium]
MDYSILQQCMHCGLCLPACPTYVETGHERNSPRGRIALMRAVADGELETTRGFADEMSYCLGCLACTTACPAGVDYTTLLETARAHVEQSGIVASPKRNFIRWLTLRFLFTRPRTLRAAGRLLWLYQASGLQTLARRLKLTALLPRSLRELEPQTPSIARHFSDALIAGIEYPKPFTAENAKDAENKPSSAPVLRSLGEEGISTFSAGKSNSRYRVAVLTGCVQDLVFSDINRATVDVLLANGCEVTTPRAQACCGSLHAHNGDLETARQLARRQLDAINPADFDAIITNAAGCGSHLKHYDRLLADDPLYAERAAAWSHKVKDISEFLVEIGFRPPVENTSAFSVQRSAFDVRDNSRLKIATYHEACHLCHGQKISAQPREILRAIPGVGLRECAEATWCCGSAGIYNITQPQTAAWLLQRKLGHLHATGADIVATANPGCHIQLENGFRQ